MYHLVHSALPFILSCPELFVGQQKFKCYFLGDVGQSQSLWRKKKVSGKVCGMAHASLFLLHAVVVLKKNWTLKMRGVLVHLILHALYSLIG